MKINIQYNLVYSIFFSWHYINEILGILNIILLYSYHQLNLFNLYTNLNYVTKIYLPHYTIVLFNY